MADIQKLVNITGSTYKLVVLAARRAVELGEGAPKLVDASPEMKVTSIAIREIMEGKVSYKIKGDK